MIFLREKYKIFEIRHLKKFKMKSIMIELKIFIKNINSKDFHCKIRHIC